jgi:hypothetical protein
MKYALPTIHELQVTVATEVATIYYLMDHGTGVENICPTSG